MGTLPKPELRGQLAKYIRKATIGAFLFSATNCLAFYYLYMLPRKVAYAEFHRTYDPEEHIKQMAKYGYLQAAGNIKKK